MLKDNVTHYATAEDRTLAESVFGEQAADIMREFGSAHAFIRAGRATMRRYFPEQPERIEQLLAMHELIARGMSKPLERGTSVLSSRDVAKSMQHLVHEQVEHFIVLALDSRMRPIAEKEIGSGDVAAAMTPPRSIFEFAIREGASGIMLVHNHPSGSPLPSASDNEFTAVLSTLGRGLGIPVVDHVIVASEGSFSYLDSGSLCLQAGV